ncbi:hypothetical protein JRO89_XSUnG0248300 [Xanthoceras sorbifolium]|uniref:Uncharacterized protein n=1 Tax=Xanthoceras sorbifolium TaxID=99658 RepID=A0ABQ8GX58_9ROSI|nr:hypothetical protein JRO89_XSUnG0248300 [Xanthoceras sorbifolium]
MKRNGEFERKSTWKGRSEGGGGRSEKIGDLEVEEGSESSQGFRAARAASQDKCFIVCLPSVASEFLDSSKLSVCSLCPEPSFYDLLNLNFPGLSVGLKG